MEDLVIRLLRQHPHFPRWVGTLTEDAIGVSLQFAVIDRWRREDKGDVDALYARLADAIVNFNGCHGSRLPVPPKNRFAGYVALHLPMILKIPWQDILDRHAPPRGAAAARKRSR